MMKIPSERMALTGARKKAGLLDGLLDWKNGIVMKIVLVRIIPSFLSTSKIKTINVNPG